MYTPVIYQINAGYIPSVGFENFGYGPSQKVISHMAQVQWLISIWGRKFYNHRGTAIRLTEAIIGIIQAEGKKVEPVIVADCQV